MNDTKLPKLTEINAEELAKSELAAAFDRAQRILSGLDVGRYVIAEDAAARLVPAKLDGTDWQRSTLASAVYGLTIYAQTGKGEPAELGTQDFLVNLIPGESEDLDRIAEDLENDDGGPLAIVIRAALGREDIDNGRPIGTTRLSALSGVSRQRIAQLVAAGELRAAKRHSTGDGLRVTAADARRWLSGRGVPGFAQPPGVVGDVPLQRENGSGSV